MVERSKSLRKDLHVAAGYSVAAVSCSSVPGWVHRVSVCIGASPSRLSFFLCRVLHSKKKQKNRLSLTVHVTWPRPGGNLVAAWRPGRPGGGWGQSARPGGSRRAYAARHARTHRSDSRRSCARLIVASSLQKAKRMSLFARLGLGLGSGSGLGLAYSRGVDPAGGKRERLGWASLLDARCTYQTNTAALGLGLGLRVPPSPPPPTHRVGVWRGSTDHFAIRTSGRSLRGALGPGSSCRGWL